VRKDIILTILRGSKACKVSLITCYTNMEYVVSLKLRLKPCISFSEKWFTKFSLLWCSISLLIGFYSVNDVALAIAAPLMTIVMYFAAIVMATFVLGFQRVNPFNSPKSKFVKYAILLFWGFGIFGFIDFLLTGIFQTTEFENSNYFMIVAVVFPLGISVGSAKEWNKYLATS
jgi:hypothetical protein